MLLSEIPPFTFPLNPLQDLVNNGAQVSICNKYGETPVDKAKPHLRDHLKGDESICDELQSSLDTEMHYETTYFSM